MIGQQISRYGVIDRLGQGGMGVVYRAEDITLGRAVALKFLPDGLAGSPEALERFVCEARSAAALNHPHICTIYEVSADAERPFIAMELLEGRTLADEIGGRPLQIPIAIELSLQIASALEAAHGKAILHRDIKPANIFVASGGIAKVLDFGLAKSTVRTDPATGGTDETVAATHLTVAGSTLGTIAYMSPEQARGQDLDGRSDLFSPLIPEESGLRDLAARTFEAHVALHGGRYKEALAPLRDLPLDGRQGPVANALRTRAEIYRHLGRFDLAIADYRKVLSRPEIAWPSPVEVLARLGLARSLAGAGKQAAARAEYGTLFEIWSDADDFPLIREARAEYARLGT